MKAILCFLTTMLTKYCYASARPAITLFAALLIYVGSCAQATISWIGDGSGTINLVATTDFNNPLNWNLLRAPIATDSVVIIVTQNRPTFLNLSADATINKLTFIVPKNNNNNQQVYLNVGKYTLTINSTSSIDLQDDHPLNKISIGVNDGSSAGVVDFKGDVVFGLTSVRDAVYLIGNPNSKIISRGNFTMGVNGKVGSGSTIPPGTLLFDGTGTQNFIFNNVAGNCKFNNIVVGATNNPTVILGGNTTPDNILGDLTVNGTSSLDLNSRQLNRDANGGNFFLKNTATLRLAALSNSANTGSATLILGSNFPSGFTNVVLDSTSTVEFYGTTQSIPGAAQNIKGYGNLTLTNNTKTLISSFAMFRKLSIAASTIMDLNSFDDTLKSNSQTTAYVGAIPTTAGITYGTGRFVVERYLKSVKSWRLLATPVQIDTTTIRTSWRESGGLTSTGFGTQITGPVPGIGMDQTTQRGSMKWFNKAINNYVEITNTGNPIARSQGYYVFVRGDRAQNTGGLGSVSNLRIKGKILTGDQVFTTLTATGPSNGFESVGNPYASKINYKTALKTNLEPSFTVWNPTAGFYGVGRFIQYVSTSGVYGDYSNGGNTVNTLESGQAFFIQATLTKSGTLTIQESDKFDGSYLVSRNGSMGKVGEVVPSLEINLQDLNNGLNLTLLDHVVMKFDNNFSNEFDQNDVRKFMNANDNLALKNGSRNLILDSRKNLTVSDTIFLSLSNTRIAPYRFQIDPSVLSNLSLKAFLIDKFLQTEIPVSLSDVTNINFTITADAASRAIDRFMIVFKNVSPAVFAAIKAVRNNDNGVAVTWNMNNENNINTYSIERSNDGGTNYTVINSQMPTANNFGNPYYTFIDAAAPKVLVWYRIKANTISNSTFTSDEAAAKAVDVNTKHGISMYPNPVVDGTVNLYFNNKPSGKYNISIVNSKGEQIKLSVVDVNNNAAVKTIAINEAAAGIYEAVVDDNKGIKLVIPFVKL